MSAELIATLGAFITIAVGMFAGFAWMIHRIEAVEGRLGTRIDSVEDKLTARIDKLGTRLDAVESTLTDVKVSIARLEGPERHLILAR